MPFVAVADVAEIHFRGEQTGQPCEMTIHAKFTATPGPADIQDLAEAMDTFFDTYGVPLLNGNVLYTGVYVKSLSSAVDFDFFANDNASAGGNGGGGTPANCAACLTKRTGMTGRSARGRMYFWGVPNSYRADNRHLTTDAAVAYSAFGTQLLNAIEAAGWTPVVVSRQTNNTPNTPPDTYEVTTLQTADLRLDHQDRRLGKS